MFSTRRKNLFVTIVIGLFLLLTSAFVDEVDALEPYAVYTAPDGFKVISYSGAWTEQDKLKSVYDELLQNVHGAEIKLLNQINIYPGAAKDNPSLAGRWNGSWNIIKGKPVLIGSRQIDIFKGDNNTTIESIARTLSHEYGHHFTYYYFFVKEQREWDAWKTSSFAKVRKLINHPMVTNNSADHKWMIQEIAAEDYVQLFGSIRAKNSYLFEDIAQRMVNSKEQISYGTDIYNYQPQENNELPLAANMTGLKEYWLQAAGLTISDNKPPSPIELRITDVKKILWVENPQYIFSWDQSSDDSSEPLEYTLVRFEISNNRTVREYPVKTVTDGKPLTAVFGAAALGRRYSWEPIPKGLGFFVVHIKDGGGMMISSQVLAVDFTDPWHVQSVLINDESRLAGSWFPPRVKVNNQQLAFDVPPMIINSRMLVPLRGIFEKLSAKVQWDGSTRSVTAQKGETEIQLQIGSTEAKIGAETVILDTAPVIINGRTLVPLRFVSESLGAEVNWNDNLRTAFINLK